MFEGFRMGKKAEAPQEKPSNFETWLDNPEGFLATLEADTDRLLAILDDKGNPARKKERVRELDEDIRKRMEMAHLAYDDSPLGKKLYALEQSMHILEMEEGQKSA